MSKDYLFNNTINVLMLDNEEKDLRMIKSYFSSNYINIRIIKNIIEAKSELKNLDIA